MALQNLSCSSRWGCFGNCKSTLSLEFRSIEDLWNRFWGILGAPECKAFCIVGFYFDGMLNQKLPPSNNSRYSVCSDWRALASPRSRCTKEDEAKSQERCESLFSHHLILPCRSLDVRIKKLFLFQLKLWNEKLV